MNIRRGVKCVLRTDTVHSKDSHAHVGSSRRKARASCPKDATVRNVGRKTGDPKEGAMVQSERAPENSLMLWTVSQPLAFDFFFLTPLLPLSFRAKNSRASFCRELLICHGHRQRTRIDGFYPMARIGDIFRPPSHPFLFLRPPPQLVLSL